MAVVPFPLAALTGLDTLLNEPPEIVDWVVSDRIPAGSVNLLVAKPKVGKTTAARHLAVAVATESMWLGSQCAFGLVWYLAFEGRKEDHLAHFRQFDLEPADAARLQCYFTAPTPAFMKELLARAKLERPALIIVDTLQRLIRVKSMEDYAQVTLAFNPLIAIARETGAALLLLHHAGKAADREALDSVLGSTAIAGSVDNTIVLAKRGGFRTVSTTQRVGPDLDECVLNLSTTGRVSLGGSRMLAEQKLFGQKLLDALANSPTPLLTHIEWLELVEGRKQTKLHAIARLMAEGAVVRHGSGKRHDPYSYSLVTRS
jgi:hypothetical protein